MAFQENEFNRVEFDETQAEIKNLKSGSESVGLPNFRCLSDSDERPQNDEGISHHRGAAAALCMAAPTASSHHSAPTSWERAAAIVRLGKRWCESRSCTSLYGDKTNPQSLSRHVKGIERHTLPPPLQPSTLSSA